MGKEWNSWILASCNPVYTVCILCDKFYQISEFARYLRKVQGFNIGKLIQHSELQQDWKIGFEGLQGSWLNNEKKKFLPSFMRTILLAPLQSDATKTKSAPWIPIENSILY